MRMLKWKSRGTACSFGELLPGRDRTSTLLTQHPTDHPSLCRIFCSCALSPCASSRPAYSFLEVSGKLRPSGKATGNRSPSYLPHHDCFNYSFSVNSINSKEAQELKKFPLALFPKEMLRVVFTEGLHFPTPLPKL